MKSPLIDKVMELGEQMGDRRYFDPQIFIQRVIVDWAENDVFFRGFDLSFVQRLQNYRLAEDVTLVLFKKPGMDCFFGYPEARTAIMNQLNLGAVGNYQAEMTATMMFLLAREGYEFLGNFKANSLIDYGRTSDHTPVTKLVSTHKSHLGKVVRRVEHVGYMMPENFGTDIMLLIPKDCVIKPEQK